jgi:hypothetical protein
MSEDTRRLADVTRAFVDRTAIDWGALLHRTSDEVERDLTRNLHLLDRIRGSRPPAWRASDGSVLSRIAVDAITALAAVQTIAGLLMLGAAVFEGEEIARAPQAVLAVSFAATTLILRIIASQDSRSLWLAAMFATVASVFTRASLSGLPSSWLAAVEPVLHGLHPEAFSPACLWQFSRDFPRVRRFASFDVTMTRIAAVVWLSGSLLFGVNALWALAHVAIGPSAHLVRDHPSQAFWHLFSVTLVPPMCAILFRARRAPARERRRIARLATVLATGAAPFLVIGCSRAVLPGVDAWIDSASVQQRVWLDSVVIAALCAMPILTTTVLVMDRPFERLRIPQEILRRAPRALVTATLGRLRRRTGRHHDRLPHALERMRLARGEREAFRILEGEIRKTLGVHKVYVRRPRPGALLRILRTTNDAVDLSNGGRLLTLLPRRERDHLAANAIELVASVKRRDGTIRAIVGCGRRPNGVAFDSQDQWFLTVLATAAGSVPGRHRVQHSAADLDLAFECPSCGRVADRSHAARCCGSTPTLAALPRHLHGKFVVERHLGTGGMGVVYLARDTTLDRDVALKTLPELRPEAVALLRDEARAMAGLNHEHLAVIYGLEVWRDTPVLIVEYLEGGTLTEKMRRGPLPLHDVAAIGCRLADALTYMHERKVLHRDIKPSNIGFTATGRVKLLDFGLAASRRRGGTPAYLPPEVAQSARPGVAFDLWALSVVLREIAADRTLRDMPPAFAAFFERALAVEPERRFRDARELRAALERLGDA